MSQFEPDVGQLCLGPRPRLLQLLAAPLHVLALGLEFGALGGHFVARGGLGLHPGGAGNGQQQRHQRPHGANQHRQEREQRNAGTVLLGASALSAPKSFHAAWAVRRMGSSLIEVAAGAVSASRALKHVDRRRQTQHGLLEVFRAGQGGQVAVQSVFQADDLAGGGYGPLQHGGPLGQFAHGGRHGRLHLFARLRGHLGPVLGGRVDRRLPQLGLTPQQTSLLWSIISAIRRMATSWPSPPPGTTANRPASSCCTRRSTCSNSAVLPMFHVEVR